MRNKQYLDGRDVLFASLSHVCTVSYPGRHWLCLKRRPPADLPLKMWIWRLTNDGRKYLFAPKSRRGLFPLNYIVGRSGQFVACGRNELDVANLQEQLITSLEKPEEEELDRYAIYVHKQAAQQGLERAGSDTPGAFDVDIKYALTLVKNAERIYAPAPLEPHFKHMLLGGENILGFLDARGAEEIESRCEKVIDVRCRSRCLVVCLRDGIRMYYAGCGWG